MLKRQQWCQLIGIALLSTMLFIGMESQAEETASSKEVHSEIKTIISESSKITTTTSQTKETDFSKDKLIPQVKSDDIIWTLSPPWPFNSYQTPTYAHSSRKGYSGRAIGTTELSLQGMTREKDLETGMIKTSIKAKFRYDTLGETLSFAKITFIKGHSKSFTSFNFLNSVCYLKDGTQMPLLACLNKPPYIEDSGRNLVLEIKGEFIPKIAAVEGELQAETLDFTDPSIGWPFQMIFRMSTILLPIGEDNNGMVQAILLDDLRPLDPFSYGTVNYVDEDGKQIHESVLFMGQTGTDYDLTSYVIPMEGFTPDKVKNDKVVHGNFSKGGDNGNVTLTYYKNDSPPIVKLITVKYEDSSGKEIHPSQNITGSYGESYDVSTDKYKLDLSDEGYVLDESQLPDNTKGIFTDQPQEIVYKYKSITSKITLNYKDELGNEIRTPITITGRKGQAYDFTVSSDETKVEGYQLDVEKLPTNAKGKFTDTDQTITLIYKSDAPASGFIEVPQAIRLHGLVEAGQKIVGVEIMRNMEKVHFWVKEAHFLMFNMR